MGRDGESSWPALKALPAAAPHFCAAPLVLWVSGCFPSLLHPALSAAELGLGARVETGPKCVLCLPGLCLTQAQPLGSPPSGHCGSPESDSLLRVAGPWARRGRR